MRDTASDARQRLLNRWLHGGSIPALRAEDDGDAAVRGHLSESPLVAIQPLGSGRPFFCGHPIGGNVACYVPLARHLGTDRPFYGLRAETLDVQTKDHIT